MSRASIGADHIKMNGFGVLITPLNQEEVIRVMEMVRSHAQSEKDLHKRQSHRMVLAASLKQVECLLKSAIGTTCRYAVRPIASERPFMRR
jgi:hypothetical protein